MAGIYDSSVVFTCLNTYFAICFSLSFHIIYTKLNYFFSHSSQAIYAFQEKFSL